MSDIFISYRQLDSQYVASSLSEKLQEKFGHGTIFWDEHIPLGTNYQTFIREALSTSKVVLAVIGDRWLSALDKNGNQRIFLSDDMVRFEIKFALDNMIPLIPIILSNASIPSKDKLPEDIQELSFMNGLHFRSGKNQNTDFGKLCDAIARIYKENELDPDKDLLVKRLRSLSDGTINDIAVNVFQLESVSEMKRVDLVSYLSEQIRANAGHSIANLFRGKHELKYETILQDVSQKLCSWKQWWNNDYKAPTALALEDKIWELYNTEIAKKFQLLSDEDRREASKKTYEEFIGKGFSHESASAITASLFGTPDAVFGPVVAANIAATQIGSFSTLLVSAIGAQAIGSIALSTSGVAGLGIAMLPILIYYAGSPSMQKVIPAITRIIQERKMREEITELSDEYSELKSLLL